MTTKTQKTITHPTKVFQVGIYRPFSLIKHYVNLLSKFAKNRQLCRQCHYTRNNKKTFFLSFSKNSNKNTKNFIYARAYSDIVDNQPEACHEAY